MEILTWIYCFVVICEQPLESTNEHMGEGSEVTAVINEVNTGCDLNGYWYNQLGSEVYLKVSDEGYIKGEYRTGVEYSPGAAGVGPSYVTGWSSQYGLVFGFTVLWEGFNTTSTSSWSGVCVPCGGVDTLTTSWVLYRSVPMQCIDPITIITGSDTFTRSEQRKGPRRADNTHNPRDFAERERLLERNGEN